MKAVITGDITPLGTGFVVTARIVAAESGNELASFQGTANSPSELIPTVGKLSRDLRGKIGESLKSVQNSALLAAVTTASLDALKKYAEGVRAFDLPDYPRAIEAVQTGGRRRTARSRWRGESSRSRTTNAGMSPALTDSALTQAYRFRDHLTEREKYTTIGTYFGEGPGRDRAKANQAYRAAMALGDYSARAAQSGQPAREPPAIRGRRVCLRARIEHDPSVSHIPIGNWDGAHRSGEDAGGRFVDAHVPVGVTERCSTCVGPEPGAVQHGKVDSASALAEQWTSAKDPSSQSRGRYGMAVGFASGRAGWTTSCGQFAEASGYRRARGAFAPPLYDSMQAALLDAWFRGQGARAVRPLDATLARYPLKSLPVSARPYTSLAQVYALAGAPARARAMLAAMDAAVHDSALLQQSEPGRQAALGLIALRRSARSTRSASSARRTRFPMAPRVRVAACVAVVLGIAFDRANMPDSAIAEFQRYLDTPFSDILSDNGDDLAFVYKSLGRLYENKGDRGEAANYYSKFVELWKNADPDLQPQVAEVKTRLTHLRDTEGHP